MGRRGHPATSLAGLIWMLPACGYPTYVVVHLDSGLAVPTETDGIDLLVRNPHDQRVLSDEHLVLDAGVSFPLAVTFEPTAAYAEDAETAAGDEGYDLLLEATALLGETPVGFGAGLSHWRPGRTTEIPQLEIERLPA
jgi:hypothetical protein